MHNVKSPNWPAGPEFDTSGLNGHSCTLRRKPYLQIFDLKTLLGSLLMILLGFPAAVVYPEGCGVRSWRLRSSPGRQHPPCSYKRER